MRRAAVLLLAALFCVGQVHATTFGSMAQSSPYGQVPAAQAVGATVIRISMPITGNPGAFSNASQLATCTAAGAAGIHVNLVLFWSLTASVTGSGPITGTDAAYEAAVSSTVAACVANGAVVDLIVIENEEDPASGDSATVAQYNQKYTDALIALHPTYKVADSGITKFGLDLAYWYALAGCTGLGSNQCTPTAASASFAKGAFRDDLKDSGVYAQLPCGGVGTFPAGQSAQLIETQALITYIAASTANYVNTHWYQTNPTIADGAIRWLEAQTGKQVVLGELGTYDQTGPSATAMLSECVSLGSPMCLWWNQSAGWSQALINDDGTLRPNGTAFKAFATAPMGYLLQQKTFPAGC